METLATTAPVTEATVRRNTIQSLVNRRLDLKKLVLKFCNDIENGRDANADQENATLIRVFLECNSAAMNQVGARSDLVVFAGAMNDCRIAVEGKIAGGPSTSWMQYTGMARAQAGALEQQTQSQAPEAQPTPNLNQATQDIIGAARRH